MIRRFIAIITFAFLPFFSLAAFTQSSEAQNTDSAENRPSDYADNHQQGNFFRRFINAYRQDWSDSDQDGPEPLRRIPPAPLTSPPFPSADWNYGGSSVIGATNTTSYPLMQAIYGGSAGEAWKNSGMQVYGWINPGFNISTSKNSNLPEWT